MFGSFPFDDYDYYDYPTAAENEKNPDYLDGQRLAIKLEDGTLVEMNDCMLRNALIGGKIPERSPWTNKKIVIL
jgi:hypothetical protein